MLELDLVY